MTTTPKASGDSTETTTPPRSDITPLAVARKAAELARANPEFVYKLPEVGSGFSACVYVHEGEGSCLFGQALLALGGDPDVLALHHDSDIAGVLLLEFGATDTAEALDDLVQAQMSQDLGHPWGDPLVLGRLERFIEAAA